MRTGFAVVIMLMLKYASAEEIIVHYKAIERRSDKVLEWIVTGEDLERNTNTWDNLSDLEIGKLRMAALSVAKAGSNVFYSNLSAQSPFGDAEVPPKDAEWHLDQITLVEIDAGRTSNSPMEWVIKRTNVCLIRFDYTDKKSKIRASVFMLPDATIVKNRERLPTEVEINNFVQANQ